MKRKIKNALYWTGYIIINVFAYNMFAFLLAMTFGFSNTMFAGLFGWTFVVVGVLITASDEDLAHIKALFGPRKAV